MAGQQQEEIETIRSRTIEVKLSDADVKRISEKAAAHGLTVGELIENFIGDLVCGTYSNGSDERMYAEQWFERCWFGMFPDLTFLRYLIEWGGLDEVIGAWENIKSTEENIQTSEEALAKERAEEVKAAFLEAAKQIPADQRQEILDRMGQQKEIPTMGRLQYYQAEAEARRQLDTALKQEAQTRERNRTHDRDRGI